MNYAYARVSAKDRTYSGRLPRLVSNGAELRYAPRERAPRALCNHDRCDPSASAKKSGTSQCRVNRYGGIRLTASAVREWSGTSLRSTRACTPCVIFIAPSAPHGRSALPARYFT